MVYCGMLRGIHSVYFIVPAELVTSALLRAGFMFSLRLQPRQAIHLRGSRLAGNCTQSLTAMRMDGYPRSGIRHGLE